MSSTMTYTEYPVDARLAPWLAAYWHFEAAPGAAEVYEHTVPLTGGAILAVVPRLGATVTGPRVSPLKVPVQAGSSIWGVHFWPGAVGPLLHCDAASLRETIVPAQLLLGLSSTEDLVDDLGSARRPQEAVRALGRCLREKAENAAPLDDAVMTAVFRILHDRGQLSIGALATDSGCSERHLRRRFRAQVGLSAKELARIQRFRATAKELVSSGGTWVDLAADHGYADQAHLVREYRRLAGITPGDFERHVRGIDHQGEIVS